MLEVCNSVWSLNILYVLAGSSFSCMTWPVYVVVLSCEMVTNLQLIAGNHGGKLRDYRLFVYGFLCTS